MPKVNLKGKNPSPAEINRRVIRAAMARAGIDFDKDVARQIGMSPSYFSTKLNEGGWKIEELQRLAVILPFTVEDAVALMGIKKAAG